MESNAWLLSEEDYPKLNKQAHSPQEWWLGKKLFFAMAHG